MPNSENLATQSKDKADIANQQFQKAFSKKAPLSLNQLATQALQNGMDNDKIGSHSVPPSLHSKYQPMPEITISVPGIIKLLCNLNPSKASGPDSIKPIVLKNLSNEIALFLSVLFQKSLDSGQVPHDWTKACVTPIFKKGDRSDPINYRPISLTCILCKVMEHIVASNLSRHFEQNDILYDLQHGFRERRSCETQLIQLVEELARNTSQGRQTDLILLDFSKAFDRVNHMKLLHKLHQHGVRGNTLSWIKAFLAGRSRTVVLEGGGSSEVPVSSGVPRGSVLGPLLFLLCINGLPGGMRSRVRLFADDAAICVAVNDRSGSGALRRDLGALRAWERLWGMGFGPSGCRVLHVSKSRHPARHMCMLRGQVLGAMDRAGCLGVDIGRDLGWNAHMDRISANAGRALGFLGGGGHRDWRRGGPRGCVPGPGPPSGRVRVRGVGPFRSGLHW